MTMTSRQRVAAAIAHEQPDRVPCDDAFWKDTLLRFQAEGMPEDISPTDYFDFDIDYIFLDASARLPEKILSEDDRQITFVSKHGYSAKQWKEQDGALHYFDHVSQTREGWERIKKRLILDVDDTARISRTFYFPPFGTYPTWEGAAEEYRQVASTGRYICLNFYGPFEATWRHHGYERSCTDLLENPDWMAEMLNVYTDLVCATIRRGLEEKIKPDAVYLVEDLGTTHGPVMSPQVFRRFMKPCYEKIFSLAANFGMNRFMHSDGRIHDLLDDLIDSGVEVLNPIDTGSGMDLVDLKRRYGRRLTLFGGISAREMHDVEKSNRQIDTQIPIAAKQGGYIFHSDHSVPPDVSLARYRQILSRVREMRIDP